jgi:hypothetical protein
MIPFLKLVVVVVRGLEDREGTGFDVASSFIVRGDQVILDLELAFPLSDDGHNASTNPRHAHQLTVHSSIVKTWAWFR